MSTTRFRVAKHTLPASHIREYPRATADDQEVELHLAIKNYVPLEGSNTNGGSVTIIATHANAFPKELYEPLWDELHDQLKAQNISITGIWIADAAHQGQSSVINEAKLGNDPSWFDHSRDLFLMINHFRKHMKRPIVGIGHSMGGAQLVNLSLMHPRLFTSLVLMDPVIQRFPSTDGNYVPAKASTVRRDRWPSRDAARAAFARSKFYQAWDPRVLEKWIEHGLRELPTLLHPEPSASQTPPTVSADPTTATVPPAKDSEREVTLTTTKHQEVFTFLRPNYANPDHPDPRTHPDLDPSIEPETPFYRPEPYALFARLPALRPSVLYVFGADSPMSRPLLRADKLANTGTGVGGSGGATKARVAGVTFDSVGHLIPMEAVGKTAVAAAEWLGPELLRWQELEAADRAGWAAVPPAQKSKFSEEFATTMMSDWLKPDSGKLDGKASKL